MAISWPCGTHTRTVPAAGTVVIWTLPARCDAMAPELKERTLRARVRRLKRLARRAGSGGTNSGSSHRSTPGPLETLSDISGPKPTPSAQGRKGGESVSPAPDGARDGDICCVASSPSAALDGRGSRKRPPRNLGCWKAVIGGRG